MRKSPSPTPMAVSRSLRELGENVQAWRKLRGLTQAQLAERAGVARATVMRLERSERSVSLENTFRVLGALGVLEIVTRAMDPYSTDLGRARSEENLPKRVRPRDLSRGDG